MQQVQKKQLATGYKLTPLSLLWSQALASAEHSMLVHVSAILSQRSWAEITCHSTPVGFRLMLPEPRWHVTCGLPQDAEFAL